MAQVPPTGPEEVPGPPSGLRRGSDVRGWRAGKSSPTRSDRRESGTPVAARGISCGDFSREVAKVRPHRATWTGPQWPASLRGYLESRTWYRRSISSGTSRGDLASSSLYELIA